MVKGNNSKLIWIKNDGDGRVNSLNAHFLIERAKKYLNDHWIYGNFNIISI